MIKIKALNDDLDSSDSSDSEYQVTREAEEESLNKLYLNALKAASNGETERAIDLLQELKQELETEIPKVKEIMLLKRLKYVTYKNLGLLKNDLELILDALEIDDSDFNLWITAGKKSLEIFDYLLAKYCFEAAYRFTQYNYIVISNLIDIYFVLNDLYNCVKMCLCALKIDPEFIKAIVLINECVRLMPPLLKEMFEYMQYISVDYGGDFFQQENEEYIQVNQEIVNGLTDVKIKRLRRIDEDETSRNKRKMLVLSIDKAKCYNVGQIGKKILALYNQIQSESYNICTPIDLDIQNKNIIKSEVFSDLEKQEIFSTQNMSTDSCLNENSKPSVCSSKSLSNLSLSDFADKRRSSRVKNIRSAKSRECDDDQSIFDLLLDLLPPKLKNNDSLEKENNSSNSASMPSIENKQDSKSLISETQVISQLLVSLESFFSLSSPVNIFELFEFFLAQVSLLKRFIIPPVFTDIYALYRQHTTLPCAILCEVEKDVTLEMIWVCLTANEINYNKNESLFLTQILNQLSEKLSLDDYRQFLIRLLVLRGTKELNNEYLLYALDICSNSPNFLEIFNLTVSSMSTCVSKPSAKSNDKSFQVIASNNLIINEQYINTIWQMQTVSVSKLSSDKNYSEVIQLFFTKSVLTLEEKDELCNAIIHSEMWQKGIELFENWNELNDKCLTTIFQCVNTGKRAHLSHKMATKILKYAVDGKSILPWSILYWSFIAEGVDYKTPNNPLIKFCKIGHKFLGRKGICTTFDGEFLLSAVKVFIEHDLEEEVTKCFTCLFNFPPRKLTATFNHTSPHIDLKWCHCKDIYDYFATDDLPEFDSRTGITQETKELFLKILRLIPEEQQPRKQCQIIVNYLNKNGDLKQLSNSNEFDSITSTIYYLLADFHFKNKDFIKAKQFYIFDLAQNISRFDSWAGLALSTNYQLDQLLIEGCSTILEKFQRTALSAIQSFEQALQIQSSTSKLWIEFGLLSYSLSGILSRIKKRFQLLGTTKELPKSLLDYDEMLNKAKNCFEKANSIESDNEELWLSYYMLGKVSEKKSENLLTTLEYYEWADLCLFLDGASYPKKINYYNPPNLAIEALEIHYRIHTSILKYLVNNRKFSARMLRQLKLHLVRASRSPFVIRKMFVSSSCSTQSSKKPNGSKTNSNDMQTDNTIDPQIGELLHDVVSIVAERDIKFDVNKVRNALIQMCIQGIKRCLSRYSAHYKSHYALAYFYFSVLDFQTAKSILLGDSNNKYNELLHFENEDGKTNSQINAIHGLFVERKQQNFFNGIWRIPVDEIERSGNFNAHMFRCTLLLIRICVLAEDPFTLQTLAIQLHKSPDADKRFLNEPERIYLSSLSFEQCFLLLQNGLDKPEVNKSRLIEDTQTIAQNFVKSNVYAQETINICSSIKNKLEGRRL